MDTGDFLKELYEGKPDKHHILIWTPNHRHSEWFKQIKDAAAYVKKEPNDVYFGVGTSVKNFGAAKRCPKNQISGIPGLWVDIDIDAVGAHKGKNYPKDMAEALSLVKGQGNDPSLIVHSGYGLHCYWIFDEFWSFDNMAARKQAAEIEQRMNVTIQDRAEKLSVDSVFDLARILRPIGGKNCKNDKVVDVKILENSGKRYDPLTLLSQLHEIPEKKKKVQDQTVVKLGPGVITDLDAMVSGKKLLQLMTVYDNFNATWANERGAKWTPSEYDLSLANMAVGIGWSDQEVVDLIIHNRRENNTTDAKKMGRRDYFEKTLRLAKENAKENGFESLANKLAMDGGPDINETIKDINELIKPLVRFIRLDLYADVPTYNYYLTLEKLDGEQKRFRLKGGLQIKLLFIENVQDATDARLILTKKQWDTLSQAFSIVKTTHSTIDIKEQVKNNIEEYLEKFEACRNSQMSELWDAGKPFKRSGTWYVQTEHFFAWHQVKNHDGDKGLRTFRSDLLDCGFEEKKPKYNEQQPDGQIVTRQKRMLEVPTGYNIP